MVWSVVVNASQSVVGLWRSYSGMVCSGECVSEYMRILIFRGMWSCQIANLDSEFV